MSSYRCKDLWRAVLESKSSPEEIERTQRFAACAAKEHMSLQLEFADRASGSPIAAAAVATTVAPLTVHIRMSSADDPQTWQPLDNASVLELLGE